MLAATSPEQRLITNFDNYFYNPSQELRRVLDWIGLHASENDITKACETISHVSRHHRKTSAKTSNARIPEDCIHLYREMCNEANKVFVPELDVNYEKAIDLFETGKHEEASTLLLQILETDPEHALAHNDLGAFYYHMGQKEKALHHFEKAVALDPSNLTTQKNLADVCLDMGNLARAIQIFETIVFDHPEDIEVLLKLGKLLDSYGMAEDAKNIYDRVLILEPMNAAALAKINSL